MSKASLMASSIGDRRQIPGQESGASLYLAPVKSLDATSVTSEAARPSKPDPSNVELEQATDDHASIPTSAPAETSSNLFEEHVSPGIHDSKNVKDSDTHNRRIILQRFTIYNSSCTMYIVGSNAKESLFRILEIDKVEVGNEGLSIIEDRNFFYTRKDIAELLRSLDENIEGGLHKMARGYGLIGFIRFTKGYFLNLITKCSQVAILGGHFVYHIDETKLIPLEINYQRPEKHSDEEKLLSIYKYFDLSKTFYFSYTYDITNTLQTNLMRIKRKLAAEQSNEPGVRSPLTHLDHNNRFVWNNMLLKVVLENKEIDTFEWFQPIIHGFIDQANISVHGKKFYVSIIARRSQHFAGARFLKRGVNDRGNVANEIETEQIVSDMLITSFHDPKFGPYNSPRHTSFVQYRGSIPLYWTQDLNKLPKPPIEISLTDPFYHSSALHFRNLFKRYGEPIIILNLIKTRERTPRELKLNRHFEDCLKYLNQFLPTTSNLRYVSFDMSRHSKKNMDVIAPLETIAKNSIDEIGFFHNGTSLADCKLQTGIIRTNCIDCLDRTNAAQFIICKEALSSQLKSLRLMPSSQDLDYDSDLTNILTEMFHDHGDTIAVQYGGSNLVNTMDSYRRINQWSSHTRDILNSVKRIYSNSFMDLIRQEAINLFLGNYIYDQWRPKLWELQNDHFLHNSNLTMELSLKLSYTHWFNEKYLSSSIPLYATIPVRYNHWSENSDNWFNECYVPRKYQSLRLVFQFNMNSNMRYFPSSVSGPSFFDYSPFESRKASKDEGDGIPNIDENRISKSLEHEPPKNIALSSKELEDVPVSLRAVPQKAYVANTGRFQSFLTTKMGKLGHIASSYDLNGIRRKGTPLSSAVLVKQSSQGEAEDPKYDDERQLFRFMPSSDIKLYSDQGSVKVPLLTLDKQWMVTRPYTSQTDLEIYRECSAFDQLLPSQPLKAHDIHMYRRYLTTSPF